MHPYAGNPTNFSTNVDLIDDSDAPDASNFNSGPEGLADRTAYLLQSDNVLAVTNWNRNLQTIDPTFISGTPISVLVWDPFVQQWLAAFMDPLSTNFYVYNSEDGLTWQQYAEDDVIASHFAMGMATNPSNGVTAALRTDGSTVYVSLHTPGTAGFVNTLQSFMGGADVGTAFYSNGQFGFVGASGFLTGTITGAAGHSTTGSGTWTSDTSSLPSGWGPGVTNFPIAYMSAISPTLNEVLIAQCGLRPGTDNSRIMTWPSFTDVTAAASFLSGTGKQIRGIVWSESDQLWGCLVLDGYLGSFSGPFGTIPPSSYLYTSPDLVTWTLVKTFAGNMAMGLAVTGSVWSVFLTNYFLPVNYIVNSNNVAVGPTATWGRARYSDTRPVNELTANFPLRFFQSNGHQLIQSEVTLSGGVGLISTSLSAGVYPDNGGF